MGCFLVKIRRNVVRVETGSCIGIEFCTFRFTTLFPTATYNYRCPQIAKTIDLGILIVLYYF